MTNILLIFVLAASLAAAAEAYGAQKALRRLGREGRGAPVSAPQRSPDRILLEWLYGGDR